MNNENYSTEIKDAEVFGINKKLGIDIAFDIDTKCNAKVHYELQPEAREWGIKYIVCAVQKVIATVEWEIDCWEMEEVEIAEFVKAGGKESKISDYNHTVSGIIEVNSTTQKWEFDTEVEFKPDGGLSIDNLTIEFTEDKIYIA